MELTIREYEFLRFVSEGEDWSGHKFVEIVDEYWRGRKQGNFTSSPFGSKYKPTGNAVMDQVNLDLINCEYPDSYIWSGTPMNEEEYIVLRGKLQSLSLSSIEELQYFINASLAGNIYIVQGGENGENKGE